ncbi:MAG: sulfatase [Betaproteobacteria bacterium]
MVLVSIDTLRPDHLGCYGYDKPTSPEIDAFRREGVLLRRVIAQAPSTLSSHASMLTSLWPLHHGASVARNSAVRPGVETLPQVLRRAGFATASWNGGGQLHRSWGLDRGFDVYVSATDSSNVDVGEDTLAQQVDAARPWLERVSQRPFFLFLHTYQVHHPYAATPAQLQRMEKGYHGKLPDRISVRLLEKINEGIHRLQPGDLEHIVAVYDGGILATDSAFGDLLRLLKRLGRYDETTIVLTSDHGEAFGERGKVGWHGDTLYDEQLRIPLIVKLPGSRFAGTRIETQVREIDLAPTLLSLLGMPVPPAFSGTVIDLAGGAADHPPWAVASIDGNPHDVALRTRRWKWYEGRLFDLRADPGERRDVVALHPEIERDLSARLAAIFQSRDIAPDTPVVQTEEARNELRSLGYVN